jgi:hypothetical protein
LVRLTHEQYVNSVRDTLGFDATSLATGFRSDAGGGGLVFTNRADLTVDGILWDGYRRAAEDIAAGVMAEAGLRSAMLSGTEDAATDEARATAAIERVGGQLHRRPLSPDDVTAYLDVFRSAAEDGFDAGMELVLTAMLQSPYFLYRVESAGTPVEGLVELDDYELASRLSYFLWNTTPDPELLDAAAAGALQTPEQLRTQAERLLADPRAAAVFVAFHEQLLKVKEYADIDPNPTFFPDVTDRLPELAREETDRFLRMLFDEGRSYRDFLTSTETFVEPDLAALYGLENVGPDWQRVTLPPDQRAGYFTQIGWLASNATSVNPDSIHRGVFLTNTIACNALNPPPDNIPPLPPPMGRTNRETVEQHTEQEGSTCAVCHAGLINPFGFAFERFDAVGQRRSTDNGFAVDSTAEPYLDDGPVRVSGALELAQSMADSEAVHACYAKHWVEFAFGRAEAREDEPLVSRLGALSRGGSPIRDLILEVVLSRPFRTRVEDPS